MKRRISSLFFSFLMLFVLGFYSASEAAAAAAEGQADSRENTPEQAEANNGKTQAETRVYEVVGMACPACGGGLVKLCKKLPAVLKAKAIWVKNRLEITVKPGAELDDEAVFEAIKKANFTPGKRLKNKEPENDKE